MHSAWLVGLAAIVAAALGAVWTGAGADGAGERRGAAARNHDWPTYLGGADRSLFSPLTQITKANVARLRQAWTYDTGDRGEFQANNLVIDGILYTASPRRKVIALEAATGRELWVWDPAKLQSAPATSAIGGRQRGLAYWRDPSGQHPARLFTSVGNFLYALDPKSGALIREFGTNGALHLGSGTTGPDGAPHPVTMNTPGVIYKDLYIFTGMSDAPGSVRAYDVRTGALRWIFHTVPQPGTFGADTWPARTAASASASASASPQAAAAAASAVIGGANNWSGSALDEARGILYVPTESATPDFWGADRQGANLFANSLIALDANSGRRRWHYQIVHHDLWDRDLPAPPVLLTVTHGGRRIDAVAQGTKQGLLFVFDRVTGEPLWPIEERPAPRSQLPGIETASTQPWPTRPAPLVRQVYTEADVSNISDAARALTLDHFRRVGSHGPYPPPSTRETIFFPGFDGGMEWGGGAADRDGIYYVNVNEVPWSYQMVPTARTDGAPISLGERTYLTQCAACHGPDRAGTPKEGFPSLLAIGDRRTLAQVAQTIDKGAGRMPGFERLPEGQRRAIADWLFDREQPADAYRPAGSRRTAVATAKAEERPNPPYAFGGFQRWLDAEQYPAVKPPWGTLNAVDLNTGEIKWRVPLGEYAALTARGLPPTGTENYGGPVVTASGLLFIAATADETIRAFDTATGEVLWQARLPFGGNATPSLYMVDGRQYLVISAGGGKSHRPAGGSIVSFALPLTQ